jgi:hypothetical protein
MLLQDAENYQFGALDLNALPAATRAQVVKLIGEGLAQVDAPPQSILSSNISLTFNQFSQFLLSDGLTLSEVNERVSKVLGALRLLDIAFRLFVTTFNTHRVYVRRIENLQTAGV